MAGKIADYVMKKEKQQGKRVVSPIWEGEKEFDFLCMGHLEMAKAMGFELQKITPVLTAVSEGQMETADQLDRLIESGFFDESYFEREATLLYRQKEHTKGLAGGGCFGPLTVVSGILGAERMLKMLVRAPEFVEKFVSYVTERMEELAELEKETGSDFFWIAEPLASLLSPEKFWQFSGQYLRKIYEKTDMPGFLHVCGKTLKHTPYMVQTGAEVLSIDSTTDIGSCIRLVDEQIVIMGNVSPAVLRYGTQYEVMEEVRRIIDVCRGFPNFVLSTGCSIMEGTPKENMQLLFEYE